MDVSIIILAHKESEYLDKCILSAKNQIFNGTFEIILSSDNEPNLESIAKKHKIQFNLCLDNKIKGSCSANLNSGVAVSKGKYIKVLPYDDWLNHDTIQLLYDGIINTNNSLIFANAKNVVNENKVTLIKPKTNIFNLETLIKENFIHGGTTLFKRIDFISLGGYNVNLKYAEEYDYHLRLLYHGKTFKYINESVFNYRIHSSQKGTRSLSLPEKIEKKKLINNIRCQFDTKLIICGLATIHSRKKGLKECIESIINQVDYLIVYQNGYKEIFNFLKSEKIIVISSIDTNIDMGDAGKFYKINDYKNCYYFSIDDDLIYPQNYVKNTISNLKDWGNNVIVTYHGRILSPTAVSYYRDKIKVNHCLHEQKEDEFVQFGGTGVMAFDTSKIKINFNYFKSPNMADIWVGKYAQENNIPILTLKHEKEWIRETIFKDNFTIFNSHSTKDNGQNNLIKLYDKTKILSYDLFKNYSGVIEEIDKQNNVVSIIIPTFGNTSYLQECLDSVLFSVKNLDCEILVGIDGCKETLNHIKTKKFDSRIKFYFFEKNVGPYIIKNSLSNISNSEIILFFDSDDIMNENMVADMLELHKTKDIVKPRYYDFIENVNNHKKITYYGEGVFSVKKEVFMSMNGFEPWRCEADSNFSNRVYKNGLSLGFTKNNCFFRRLHSNSLTQNPKTGYNSEIRKEYRILSSKSNGELKLPNLVTENFTEIKVEAIVNNNISKDIEITHSKSELIKNSIKDSLSNRKEINYDKVNSIIKTEYVKEEVKKVSERKPIDREKLIEIKKDSLKKTIERLIPSKPNRRTNLPNIFSGKKNI